MDIFNNNSFDIFLKVIKSLTIVFFVMFFCNGVVLGQNATITSSVNISASGGYGSDGKNSISWTVGEPIIFTATTGGFALTQGFHQIRLRTDQTISNFNGTVNVVFNSSVLTLSGVASSGLDLSYVSSNHSILVLNGNLVRLSSVGIVTITAQQLGNTYYRAAPNVIQVYNITKANQAITGFNAVPKLTVGDVYSLANVNGGASQNSINFKSSDSTIAKVQFGVLNTYNNGVITLTATQLGNTNYQDALPKIQVVTIVSGPRVTQNIVGTPTALILGVGSVISLTGYSTSGLPVTFSTSDATISIAGNFLTTMGVGTGIVKVNQVGNVSIAPAPTVYFSVLITSTGMTANSSLAGILGKTIVVPSINETTYQQILTGNGYTYKWEYKGGVNDITIDSGANASVVKLRYNSNAIDGKLYNYVYDSSGALITYSQMDITVTRNEIAQIGATIPEVKCKTLSSDCAGNYIRNVNIDKLNNATSCNPSGYGDYTTSGKIDTLTMGNVYHMRLQSKLNVVTAYYAVWIDYNKNGSFDDAGEFVSSSFADDTLHELKNLLIRNDPSFVGFTRLRVKMQVSGSFSAGDGCQTIPYSKGETEDYLVYIRQSDKLQAPNMITPNNDGRNDYFVVKGVDVTKSNRLVILDRWGNVKFEQSDYQNDWAGIDMNGTKLPRSTYFYFFTNGTDEIKGFVEIIDK